MVYFSGGCIQPLTQILLTLPHNNVEIGRITEKFYHIARFPRVIGAIDCTLIRIQSPCGQDAEIFRCTKGFFCVKHADHI